MCAKKTPSRMQNERTGELNLGINIKTFNSNKSFSSGKEKLFNPKNKKVYTEIVVKEWRRDKYWTKLGKVLFS